LALWRQVPLLEWQNYLRADQKQRIHPKRRASCCSLPFTKKQDSINCFPATALSSLPKINEMVTKFSHTTLYVQDQDKAYDFYVNILGFKVNTDTTMENGFRWLTVNPPEQPEIEVVLMPILHKSMLKTPEFPDGINEECQQAFKVLLNHGILGAGVMQTNDCRATYEELKAKGVQFKGEPKEQFYGTEVVMFDGCGNWFSVTQPK
jgi:catechol 2,3-dioxygenase-like lactoylglutathione lyase family enzyme